VNAVAISRDGSRIVSNSDGGTIKIWDAASGNLVLSLNALEPQVALMLRPDGSFWTGSEGLERLRLVRGNESVSVPEDYKAAFMRETPFEAAPVAAAR
jgi:WD40 repeat protein